MRKVLVFTAVVAVLVVVASTASLAQDKVTISATAQFRAAAAGKEGQMYERPPTPISGLASMPTSGDAAAGFASTGGDVLVSTEPGPLVANGSDLMFARGSALVGPTGGAVYSPQQRAASEIRRVIRALD
jgi:hypothetical protein